jgi:hypothetical protein
MTDRVERIVSFVMLMNPAYNFQLGTSQERRDSVTRTRDDRAHLLPFEELTAVRGGGGLTTATPIYTLTLNTEPPPPQGAIPGPGPGVRPVGM